MNQPQPARPITVNRVLMFIAGACAFLSALVFAGVLDQIGPGLAWLAGGISAFFFSQAV